jgi:transcription-repair coupling factor (superfamily II helicase)
VGRSDKRAYAYLFHPEEQTLTETAYRRLQAIGEATELGAGFQLAQKDLEIRGAGSILGEVQSGHIAAVGFDLYVKLVSEAVSDLQGLPMQRPEIAEVRIELPVDAHLPESYVDDQLARLEAYRKLAVAATAPAVDEVEAEWRERFGTLPPEASVLINIARLRTEAIRVGLEEILALRHEVRLGPVDLSASQEVRLSRLEKRSVLNPSEGRIFLPKPATDIVARLISFMQEMWPDENA